MDLKQRFDFICSHLYWLQLLSMNWVFTAAQGAACHHHSEFWLLRGTLRGWLVMEGVLAVHAPLQFLGYPLSCIMKLPPILPRRISKRCRCIIYESFLPPFGHSPPLWYWHSLYIARMQHMNVLGLGCWLTGSNLRCFWERNLRCFWDWKKNLQS